MKNKESVLQVIKETVRKHGVLSAGLFAAVCGAVIFALLPPLILAQLIDRLTKNHTLWTGGILLYFGLLALTGFLESARESLLTVFGQRITHALRSSLMEKFGRLSANELNRQEPGALVSRFVGDVDTVENLFTSGIISMFADACKILSILVAIWVTNRGLTIVLIVLLPVLFLFTRYVQKNMLASQIANRRAVSRASGHVPETLHNIRTIHCLQKETYMEQQYARYIDDSYSAMEKTNF
ncbi:MAG: ABC transporter transmembrane domain-containing protein, partial [Clostridium sp.]